MNRRGFITGAASLTLLGANGKSSETEHDFVALQSEVDQVKGADFYRYLRSGTIQFDAIRRLDMAFDKVLNEVKLTKVTGKRPAVWLVYNMGVIVKTATTCFSIDLMHRRAKELAPLLDFALISHNHGDHYTEQFYAEMNGDHKTVISNFLDNYGVRSKNEGGYTRLAKTFAINGVRISTTLSDHNDYLIDFTTTFDIDCGGFRIFHSGDSFNLDKINPKSKPDLWLVHPRCGVSVAQGVKKFAPKMTVISHINELGHDKYRWSWQEGLEEKEKVEGVGGKAMLPVWGDRIC